MELKELCEQTCELVRQVGQFIKEESHKITEANIEVKGKNNFVTYVDKKSEAMLVEGLKKILPDAGFIAEEGTESNTGENFMWIIDPLDGTTNFIHGCPPFSISVGLAGKDETLLLGVVYEIFSGECFYAWKGGKSWLNGKQISVSSIDKTSDALIATGFPYSAFEKIKSIMGSLEYLFFNSHGVRRLGSAAIDLAYVACGRYDAFYEYNLNPWDVAAGAIIVLEAGGKVSDFKGGKNFLYGREVIASNKILHNEFQNIIEKCFS